MLPTALHLLAYLALRGRLGESRWKRTQQLPVQPTVFLAGAASMQPLTDLVPSLHGAVTAMLSECCLSTDASK